jgi:iron complex outermembrane receptor protein
LGYYHAINDYIFLKPTGEYEINISGSYPIYRYSQTDGRLLGSDILISYAISPHLKTTLIASFLKGDDVREDLPLIFMPPNNALLKIKYAFSDASQWRNSFIGASGKLVTRQNHLLPEQDFKATPDGYFLLGFEAGTSYNWKLSTLDIGLRIDNALNTVYRDYLNRLRYFADDLGINVSLRTTLHF